MRLLLLIPNFALMLISGYNLSNMFTSTGGSSYLTIIMLHVLVMILCLAFSYLILKSLFVTEYVDVAENAPEEAEDFEAVHMQHS